MSRVEDYVGVTGIVLDITVKDVKFNFGYGAVWIPKDKILDNTFVVGHIKDWRILKIYVDSPKMARYLE